MDDAIGFFGGLVFVLGAIYFAVTLVLPLPTHLFCVNAEFSPIEPGVEIL